jgi:hypothetical protein
MRTNPKARRSCLARRPRHYIRSQTHARRSSCEPNTLTAASSGYLLQRASDVFSLDFNFMKAVSKIESDFDPKQRTGSYSGLFQLSKGEFAEYGSGDILDARDNAVAAATNPRPCGRSHPTTARWTGFLACATTISVTNRSQSTSITFRS